MLLFPLTTRSLHKTTVGERLRAWNLDIQPGNNLEIYESHYRDCMWLEEISRQIQAWVELDERDFHSIYSPPDEAGVPFSHTSVSATSLGQASFHRIKAELLRFKSINQFVQTFDTLDSYPESIRLIGYPGALRDFDQHRSYKDPVAFLRAFREHCLSDTYLKAQANAQRRERKAHRSRVQWVNELFQEYACLRVVHLMLASTPIDDFSEEAYSTLHSQCHTLLHRLAKKKNPICTGTVGYLWRIFHHPRRGFRLLIVLLLDPDYCEKGASDIATSVARHWMDQISHKQGVAALAQSLESIFPTKSTENKPEASATSQVGNVHRDNPNEVGRLQSLLDYLATLDHFGDYAPSSVTGEKRRRPRSQGRGNGPWRRKRQSRSTTSGTEGNPVES